MSSSASCSADGGSCALPAKGDSSSRPSADAVGSRVSYADILAAEVQPLDLTSSANPLSELAARPLGDYITPEQGAIVYLVRRPGCALCREDGRQLSHAFARYFPEDGEGSGAAPAAGSHLDAHAAAAAAQRHDPSAAANHKRPAFLVLFKENLSFAPETSEIREFLPSVPSGFPLLHSSRSLYKALGQPKLGLWDMLSFGMLRRYASAKSETGGNLKGEGTVKGAIFVLGTPEQGVLCSYLEEFGRDLDFTPIEDALKKLPGAKKE